MSETEIKKERLYDKGVFIPMKAVAELANMTNLYPLVTPVENGEPGKIWLYSMTRGIWRPNGETLIESLLQQVLKEEASSDKIGEVVKLVKIATYHPSEAFIEDPGVIVLRNGTLDLATGTLKEHDSLYNAKNALPIKYDPKAECPEIEKFLKEVAPDSIDTILEWFGYHLVKHHRYHKCLVLLGCGRNGKSSLLNLLGSFLGHENISSESLFSLTSNRFATAQLYTKLANISPDLGADELRHTGIFKALTGGDTVHAEHKYQPPFSFVNYAKLSFSCNQLPVSPDESAAFFSRFLVIEFKQTFEGDRCNKHIIDELTTEEELSGLLNLALQGLTRLQEKGDFTYSPSTTEIREKYIEMSDPITSFVNTCIIEDVDAYEVKDHVYRTYYNYCKQRGYIPVASNKFTPELKARAYCRDTQKNIDDKKGVHIWAGIRLCETCLPRSARPTTTDPILDDYREEIPNET